jgi:hypothetical protein
MGGGLGHAEGACPWERQPVPTVHEDGWAPRPVWTGAENLVPIGIRSLDLPARSESLYQLRYSGPLHVDVQTRNMFWKTEDFGMLTPSQGEPKELLFDGFALR